LITAVMTAFRSSLMRRAMRTPIENGGEELVQMGTVSTCLAAAFLSDWFGLGMEAGAFVGGVAVGAAFGRGEESHQSGHHSEGADPGAEGADPGADTAVDTERKSVADVVGSFTRMFEAIQFVSVGVVLRPWYVVEHAYWLLLVLTFLITVKTCMGGVVMHVLDGCPKGVSWVIGGCVANVSEFSFAIVNRAYLLGIVGKERYRPMLCLCVLSWLSAPVLNYRVVPWVLRGGRGRGRRR
jgi:Kef-type K+ transport system membrane component KefB